MKFDWIDFGYSWKENWESKILDKEFHTSTASLLSNFLRGRSFRSRKIFLWLRSDQVHEISETNGVVHVEATFPFDRYRQAINSHRLEIFANWIVLTISNSFPELLCEAEIGGLTARLVSEDYVYMRKYSIPISAGGIGKCKVIFEHSPIRVTAKVICPKIDRALELPDNLYRRDEMDYGRSVDSCAIENGRITAKTSKGLFQGP